MKKPTSYERRRKKTICLYVDEKVRDDIKDLSDATRISQSDYLREALDDLLEKYKRPLNKYRREQEARK